jgi:hypothetical protein
MVGRIGLSVIGWSWERWLAHLRILQGKQDELWHNAFNRWFRSKVARTTTRYFT